MNSILREWVMRLPLREQGTLLTAYRGCDLTPKLPLDSTERKLVAAIRFAIGVPFDPREVDSEPGCFMQSNPPLPSEWKASEFGHYPLHWFTHIMHTAEIIAYRHPDNITRLVWEAVYLKLVHSLHLLPETREQMMSRLSEDRIAKGEIVS
jgi:hypothetical protein